MFKWIPGRQGSGYDKIVLLTSKTFLCDAGRPIYSTSRIQLFRPDLYSHSVTKVEPGTRYVLSIGWLRKEAP